MFRKTSLAAAIALGMGIVSVGQPVAHAEVSVSHPTETQATYLVTFIEPSVATFRGFKAAGIVPKSKAAMALAPTSPAVTGARHLDVDSPASLAYRGYLADQRKARLVEAEQRIGRELKPDFIYQYASNGMALQLTASEAEKLRQVPGVKRVLHDFKRKPMTDAGPRWIHANQIWDGPSDIANQGEGVVVGVIDSGIYAAHPAFAATGPVDGYVHQNPRSGYLGLCAAGTTTCNDKLIGIYDLTTSGGDAEANDGSDKSAHGTHVASTAAGNHLSIEIAAGTQTPISGVAPHANLIAYKACEVEATCEGAWLTAAIDQAIADQVDVINYSIGGGTNNPWGDGDSLGFLDARQAGIVPVVAAGNDGPDPSTVSSPGNAPWVLSVAAVTHDRTTVNMLTDFSGGDGSAPSGGVMYGAGATTGYGPADIVYAGDHNSPLCAQGSNVNALPPDNSTNPWPTSAGQQEFNGEIVVCDRGTYARVIKSYNVGQAGGGGFVLVNDAANGENVVRDAHSIPGIHLGYSYGVELKEWLSHGSGHKARISGEQLSYVAEFGDHLASFSGRGPTFWGSYLAPNVAAPGVNIIAAYPPGIDGATAAYPYGYMSGTSMATPHVTGAVALLVAAHPDWTPSQLMSALRTTARDSVILPDGNPATPLDAGSGTIDLAKAVRAGLYFPIERSDFSAASSGDTKAMNLPALVDVDCFLNCSLSRTVTDMAGGGTWTAELEMPNGATAEVTPSTFTLAAGASQTLNFSFDVSGADVSGDWVSGRLKLVRSESDDFADLDIPIAINSSPGELPESIVIETGSQRGYVDYDLGGLVALPEARFASSALFAIHDLKKAIKRNPNRPDDYAGPYDDSILQTYTIRANANARTLVVETDSDVPEIHLFVGQDTNADGLPSQGELLCGLDDGQESQKRCEIGVPPLSSDVPIWILARNYNVGPVAVPDMVELKYYVMDENIDSGTSLAVTGPGHVDEGESFNMRISWDAPELLPNGTMQGFLLLGAKQGREGKTGRIPVTIKRTGEGIAAEALVSDRERRMALAAGSAHEYLFIDVPPNATRLEITSSGSGEVDLYAAWAGDFTAPSADSGIAAAPARGEAQGSSIHPGADEAIDLQGAVLKPGRWYITPVNSGADNATFTLTAKLSYASADVPTQQFGGYYNPARSGSGAFLYQVGDTWALIIYTYLQDGSPTWFLGSASKPVANASAWNVPMYRFAWDGNSAFGRQVGEANLSLLNASQFVLTSTLDGEVASQTYIRVDPGTCPLSNGSPVQLSASWYPPAFSGSGYSVTAIDGLEAVAAYFYDDQGVARWAIGSAAPFGTETLPMTTFNGGACLSCTYQVATGSETGHYTRSYAADGSSGHALLDINLTAPLSGHWMTDADISPLTEFSTCQ